MKRRICALILICIYAVFSIGYIPAAAAATAWADRVNRDFTQAERAEYIFEDETYYNDENNYAEDWSDGYKFINKGASQKYIYFIDGFDYTSASSRYKFGFEWSTNVISEPMRLYVKNTSAKNIAEIQLHSTVNGTSQLAIKFASVTLKSVELDPTVKMKVEIIFDPVTTAASAAVNGVTLSDTDGNSSFTYNNGGLPSRIHYHPMKKNQTTQYVCMYDMYIQEEIDPTSECSYSNITSEQTDNITQNLNFDGTLSNGATVEWKSSKPTVIDENGVVTPSERDEEVTVTAIITYNGEKFEKNFDFIVPAIEYMVWAEPVVDLDFTEAERETYSFDIAPESWVEEWLADGGYKFTKKDDTNPTITFFGPLENLSATDKYRFGFVWSAYKENNAEAMRLYVRNSDDEKIAEVQMSGSQIRVKFKNNTVTSGETDSTEKMKVEIIFDPVTKKASAAVNGETLLDGFESSFTYDNGGVPACAQCYPMASNWADAEYVRMYDMYIQQGVDPTAECSYSNLTDEEINKITGDLELMGSLSNGAGVSWESSNPSVISDEATTLGKVYPGEYDETVILTATITYNGQSVEKKFFFIVSEQDKTVNNLILDENSFDSSAPHYDMVIPAGSSDESSCHVQDGKLMLARRIAEGSSSDELSATKYFVSNREDDLCIIKGDKVILEQYMRLRDDIESGMAQIYNEDNVSVAQYGVRKVSKWEYEFVCSTDNGNSYTSVPYVIGSEIFVRTELDTNTSQMAVMVDNILVDTMSVGENSGISSVKYTAGEGAEGSFCIDNVMLMIEGTEHDLISMTLDKENLTFADFTSQSENRIISSLMPDKNGIFGSSLRYESSNTDVLSNDGFVKRQEADTEGIIWTAYIKKGQEEEITKSFGPLSVIGADAKNLAIGKQTYSSGSEDGYAEINAVDGIDDGKAFVTAATDKYITVSLGAATMINKVILKEAENEAGAFGVKGFTIDVSDDNYTWTTVHTGTNTSEEIIFNQVSTKYVRYHITDMDGAKTGLYEFEIYYEPIPSVAIKLDLAELAVTPSDYVISSDVTLSPSGIGTYGSAVSWKSSHPLIVSDSGQLLATPETGTVITLTATVTNGDAQPEIKTFTHFVSGSTTSGGNEGGGSGGGGGIKSPGMVNTADNSQNSENEGEGTQQNTVFGDVGEDRWSYNYIKELKDAGIVSGDGVNFYPASSVKREEYVKMLLLTLGIEPGGKIEFSDAEDGAWYGGFIAAAVKNGIVQGISETEFGVGRSISRQDMAVMTVRALQATDKTVNSAAPQVFSDGDDIADYAKEAINLLAGAGILSGDGGRFNPRDNLTREQVAKVLCMIRKEIAQ